MSAPVNTYTVAEPPVGTVLVYHVELGDKTYHYASLRAGDGRWHTTGISAQQGVSWPTLLAALRAKKARLWVAEEWRRWSL